MNVLILTLVAVVLGTVSVLELNNSNSKSVEQYETLLREDYDKNIKNQVENVIQYGEYVISIISSQNLVHIV